MSEIEVIDVDPEAVQNLPAVRASEALVARGELTVAEVVGQREKIIQVMQAVMKPGVHYGVIPGVDKPSLFKPGAETINVALRLAPHYDSEKIWHENGHLTVVAKCTLKHIPTDLTIATGEGLCTTKETRYASRNAQRVCPACGQEAIIKGKAEYGGGWVCFKRKGGCGAKYADGDEEIEGQVIGKIDNPEIADTYNTVLKMADKRALIAAVLNGTAASDVFTQDVEDAPRGRGAPPQSGAVAEAVAEVRREGPEPLPKPRGWAKITEYASAYDEETYTMFMGFAESARRRLFPGSVSTEALSRDERNELFQVTARAVMALREAHDPADFPPPGEDDLRRAWASVMEGEELSVTISE